MLLNFRYRPFLHLFAEAHTHALAHFKLSQSNRFSGAPCSKITHVFSCFYSSCNSTRPQPSPSTTPPHPSAFTFSPFVSESGYYYAVRRGWQPGIYGTHHVFDQQVTRFSGAEGKRFRTYVEAYQFLCKWGTPAVATPAASLPGPRSKVSCEYPAALFHLNAAIHPAPLPKQCLRIYTDGSFNVYRKAGIGVWIEDNHPGNLSAPFEPLLPEDEPSSNKAEIQAATRALARVPPQQDVEIRTDSLHVLRGITAYFQHRYQPGFFHSSVLVDQVYFKELANHIEQRKGRVFFVHVKAHVGVLGNERADQLAKQGAAMADVGNENVWE